MEIPQTRKLTFQPFLFASNSITAVIVPPHSRVFLLFFLLSLLFFFSQFSFPLLSSLRGKPHLAQVSDQFRELIMDSLSFLPSWPPIRCVPVFHASAALTFHQGGTTETSGSRLTDIAEELVSDGGAKPRCHN